MENSGIAIWIEKKNVDFECQSRLFKIINKHTELDDTNFYFSGRLLLLLYKERINSEKFKYNLSKICTNNFIYCHVIIADYNGGTIVIINFNHKLKTKNLNLFKNIPLKPLWYVLNEKEYLSITNLIQFNSYEEIYLESSRSYADNKMVAIKQVVGEFGDKYDKKIKQFKYHLQNEKNINERYRAQINELYNKIDNLQGIIFKQHIAIQKCYDMLQKNHNNTTQTTTFDNTSS